MNKYVFLFLVSTMVFTLQAQYTQIPDANFEAALSAYDDIANDGQIPTANIENLVELVINNKSISDLTGIEAFSNLEELNVSQNNLTTLDLSSNTNLVDVNIWNNDIVTLNIQNLIKLKKLTATTNELTALDVSTNLALTTLSISFNDIVSLDLTGLTKLEQFTAFRVNTLETVILKNNTLLNDIYIGRCKVSTLDLAECPNLEEIYLNSNQFTTIDFSNNPLLKDVDVSKNQLTSIDLRTGNTQNFTNIDLLENPDLTCVSIDDPEHAILLFSSEIDPQTKYSKECGVYTYIPDDNFETALNVLGLDDLSGDNHILNANAALATSLNISSYNISNLDGINVFTNLTNLNVSKNQLQEIDLSANTLLEVLNVSENSIQVLDVSLLTNLTSIETHTNQLFYFNLKNGNNGSITSFSANNNTNLTCILVDDVTTANANFLLKDATTSFSNTTCTTVYTTIPDVNFEDELSAYDDIARDGKVPTIAIHSVTSLYLRADNISDLTGIEDFFNLKTITLSRNNLSTVDFSKNLKLAKLTIDSNNLSSLDVTNNSLLQLLNTEDNDLTAIDLTNNPLLKDVNLSRNNITTLDLANNTLLEELDLAGIAITSLDLSTNTKLKLLNVNSLDATSLNLSNNTYLEELDGEGSALETLNITGLTKLKYIRFSEGVLTALDTSTNTALEELDLEECDLTTINLTNNLALNYLSLDQNVNLTEAVFGSESYLALKEVRFNDTQLTSLKTVNMPVLVSLRINDTKISSLDVSENSALIDLFALNTELEVLNIKNGNNTNLDDLKITGNAKLYCVQVDDEAYANTNFTDKDAQVKYSTDCESCTMNIRAILEGAFNSSEFEMNDDLRVSNLIPTTSPYEDAATCDTSIFDISTSSAVVDWVEIQLRSADDINEIVARKSFFLQKSSSVMNADGSSTPIINAWQGNYYVAIAHRNHLKLVTKEALAFKGNSVNVDFTSEGSVLNGTNALVEVTNSVFALPAGNVSGNGQIQNTDINSVVPNLGLANYSLFDIDMNGQVQNADINLMMQNVGKGEQF